MQLLERIGSIIAPAYCRYCKVYLSQNLPLCSSCLALIKPTLSETLSISSKYAISVYTVSAYEEPLKTLILAKNFHDYETISYLGSLLANRLPSLSADYVIPVPLHPRRQAQRGFNQAIVMAKQVSASHGMPVLECVQRIRYTELQSRFSRLGRYENVKDAFNVTDDASLIQDKSIVLIDDMLTSGATLAECARVLSVYKPKEIKILVVCDAR